MQLKCRDLPWLNHLENVLGGNLEFPFSPVGKLSDFPRSRLGETSRFLDLSLCWLLSDDLPLDSWWLWWRRSDSPPCSRFWTAFRPLSKCWSSVAICERRSFKKLSLFVSFDRAVVELEPYHINMNLFLVTKKHAGSCNLHVFLPQLILSSICIKHVGSLSLIYWRCNAYLTIYIQIGSMRIKIKLADAWNPK